MSEKYKPGNARVPHFITITIVDWVDLFTKPIYKQIVINSFKYCIENKGMVLNAFCIMPNHVHAIIHCSSGNIGDLMRDFKKFTSKALIKAIQSENESRKGWLLKKFRFAAKRVKRGVYYKIWQDGYHPVELNDDFLINQKLDYIHDNPVVEEFVHDSADWVYSSAGFYMDNSKPQLLPLQMPE